MEISLWLSTVDRSKGLIRDQQRRLEIFQADSDRVENTIAEKEAYIEKRYLESNDLIRKGDENQAAIRAVTQRIAEATSEKAVAESGINYDRIKIEELEKELQLYTSQQGETDSKKAQCEAQLAQLETRKQNLLENQKFAEEQLNTLAQQAKETDSRKGELLEKEARLISEVQNSKMELHGIDAQNASVMQTAEKAKADLETAKGYLATAQGELDEILAFADEVQRKITQNTNIKNGIALKLNGINEKLEKANEALAANSNRQFETSNRIRILTDMENNLDGFQQSVKNILTNGKNGRLKGIIGTVAQLINVEKGYETAIEIALGHGLQNIVVQDESSAKQAIEFLKNTKGGRATFLPLDTVKASTFSENLPDWATTADRVIAVDSRYSHIISNQLGRTVICDDINYASRLAKQLNYRYRIVTKDGQPINAGGSFTGGSVSKSAGLFTRKGEIEKLKENLAVLKKEYTELEKTASEIKENCDLLGSQIGGCNAEIDTLTADKNNCNVELAKYTQLVSQYNDSIYLYEGIIENSEGVVADNNQRKAQLEKTVAESENELEVLAQQIASIGQSDSEYNAKREAAMETLQQIRLDIVTLSGEMSIVQNNINQLVMAAQQGGIRKAQIVQDIQTVNQRISEKQAEIAAKSDAICEMQAEIVRIEEENRDFVALRMEIEKERNEISAQTRALNDEHKRLSVEIAKISEKIANMETGYDEIIQKLWEEYELTVQTAREFAFQIEDENQLRKDLSAVKGAIKRLGNVNVAAIEEYKEVYEKYNFLKEQLKDLEDSRQQLQKLITSLNGEMKTLFGESFKIINDNFGKIFRQLFGGGSATLKLTDPENILESGVDISVNPPGKVIKSLTALSGGEQALVAISIYFAILAHNPSPFCILDEIEAALDDANVTRYANYLHDISDTTQFIVITHRRGTMESADVLYGVTMQEDGISKLLKLDVNNVSPSLIN